MFFKSDGAEIKTQEYYNLLHTYCNTYHERYLSDSPTTTSTDHLLNETVIYWCSDKEYDKPQSIPNSETKEIYTGVLDKNWIIYFTDQLFTP